MQRECKFCDDNQMVNMEKPQGSEKWIVTNLDGSIHRHNTPPAMQYLPMQRQQQQQEQQQQQQQRAQQQNSLAADRIAEIKQAHEENMEASSRLTSAVNRLTDAVVNIEKLLDAYVRYQQEQAESEVKNDV